MAKRKIIEINEKKCNGCKDCIPNCPEGALLVIDGKARLVSDLFCDGLGACIGHCPKGAIKVVEREAKPYDEKRVMKNIVKCGKNTIIAHLNHLKKHGETKYLNEALEILENKKIEVDFKEDKDIFIPCECPSSKMMEIKAEKVQGSVNKNIKADSELSQWPIQFNLLPPQAPFFKGADILIAADCTGFAHPNFHQELLKGKKLLIGCPKFDDIKIYKEKIKGIISLIKPKSLTVAIMEVPCCYSLYAITEEAVKESGKKISLKKITIGIDGKTK